MQFPTNYYHFPPRVWASDLGLRTGTTPLDAGQAIPEGPSYVDQNLRTQRDREYERSYYTPQIARQEGIIMFGDNPGGRAVGDQFDAHFTPWFNALYGVKQGKRLPTHPDTARYNQRSRPQLVVLPLWAGIIATGRGQDDSVETR